MLKARASCRQAYRDEFLHGLKYVLLVISFKDGDGV